MSEIVGWTIFLAFLVAAIVVLAKLFTNADQQPATAITPTAPLSPAMDGLPLFERFAQALAEELKCEWFYQRVAGVTFANDDGGSRQDLIQRCKPRQILALVPDPDNPHGQGHAVKVIIETGEQIGFLPSYCAAEVFPEILKGRYFAAMVAEVGKSADGKHWGMRIVIFRGLAGAHLTHSSAPPTG